LSGVRGGRKEGGALNQLLSLADEKEKKKPALKERGGKGKKLLFLLGGKEVGDAIRTFHASTRRKKLQL